MAELILGPIDELPQLRTNTTLLLGFALPDRLDRAEVLKCLQAATNTLVDKFPYLAGQITVSEASEDKLDASKHVPGHSVAVIQNDLSEDFPHYQQIINAKAPASMLDGSRVSQGDGFPTFSSGHALDPCFGMKANFVRGGLLLTFALSHSIGDGTSLGQVIKMFATACRGDIISKADIEAGNMNRLLSLPSLRSGENLLEHSDITVDTTAERTTPINKDEETTAPLKRWAYFRISDEKLAQLKAEALADLSVDDRNLLISSNDGFTVLIWRAITLARLPHLDPNAVTTILRAVNCRRKLDPPLPDTTLQNIVTVTHTRSSLQDFSKIPLGTLASKLRKDLLGLNDHHVRSMATHLRSTRDKNLIRFGARFTPSDMVISSFAHMPICTSDFGPLLGQPNFVRRPTLTAADGVVYLMPKNADGSIDAAISMRVDDLERMHLDEKWAYYTEYIG